MQDSIKVKAHIRNRNRNRRSYLQPFGSNSAAAPTTTSMNTAETPSVIQPAVSSASKQEKNSPRNDSEDDTYESK